MRLPDCTRKRWLFPIVPLKFSLVHMWVIPILERKGRQWATTLGCGLGPGVVNSGQLSKHSRELVARGLRLCHGAGHGSGSRGLVGRGLLPPWCWLCSRGALSCGSSPKHTLRKSSEGFAHCGHRSAVSRDLRKPWSHRDSPHLSWRRLTPSAWGRLCVTAPSVPTVTHGV